MSLTEYFTERRKAMEDFLRASYKVYSKLRKIKYIDTDEPRDLIRKFFSAIEITSLNTLYHRFQWFLMKSRGAQ